jgi:capsular exopolysaccharide synthesis family protein
MEEKDERLDENKSLEKISPHALTTPQRLYSIPETPEEEIHLRDYLSVIIRRRWYFITFFIVVVTTVTIGTFMMKPQYKATITIKIDKENPNILSFKDVVGLERAEEDYYQTQYKILKSNNLAKRVIRSLRLYDDPEFVKKRNEDNQEGNILGKKSSLLDDEIEPDIITSFLSKVEVSPLQKSRLVNVSFISHSPELSARVANEIGRAFIDLNIESKFEATHQAKEWLEKQLEVMKARVEQAEEKLNKYAEESGIILIEKINEKGDSKEAENIVSKKLAELSTELTTATSDRISKEALYKEISKGDPESSSVVMNNPLITELKKKLVMLEADYQEQLKIYKPEYPKMVRLKESINQTKDKIKKEIEKIVSSIKKDYEIAVKREKQLKATLESQKKEALDLNQKAIQYQILKREADTNKELYNGLLQRLKETGVSANLTTSNIQILDKADIPKTPFKPKKTLNILLSVIVGLFGGIGIAIFVEYLDNTIKTPEDLEKKVYLPPLGYVPYHADNKDNLPVEYIAHVDGNSPISEAYRSIRTFILLSTGGNPPRVIMVTSPIRSEGKTTTSLNTAISLTKSNSKVVIIDADMRRPKLHNIFSVENIAGLSTFLSGNINFGEHLIKKTYVENLDLISSGPIPPNPAELLSSSRFQELIYNLYSIYNFIIIDTPPVIGISDPLIISSYTDGVILVIRSGMTDKNAVKEARRLLLSINAKILGVVLNSIDEAYIRYSHYYNYYKYYYTNEDK